MTPTSVQVQSLDQVRRLLERHAGESLASMDRLLRQHGASDAEIESCVAWHRHELTASIKAVLADIAAALAAETPPATAKDQTKQNLEYMAGVVCGALAAVRLAHTVLEAAAQGVHLDPADAEARRLMAAETMAHLSTLREEIQKAIG